MPDTEFIDELIEDEGGEQEQEEQNSAAVDLKIEQALSAKEKGFYNEMRAERQKRQEIQSQLDKLTGTINVILESRKDPAAALPAAGSKSKFAGIPVAETESGELYIPEEHLVSLVKPYEEKIRNLETYLQRSNVARNVTDEAEKAKMAMVGESESYGPAFQKYQAARKWANDRVVEFQRENGVTGQMTSGQALDVVFDEAVEKEFAQKFPGLPLDEIVTAEDSQRNFRKMLKVISSSTAGSRVDTTGQEKLKRLLKKPSGLGSTPNAKAGHVSIGEKMSSFTPEDIMSLTDAQVEALHRAMRSEETEEGLSFT